MKNWYKKSQADSGNLNENEYIARVKVNIHHLGLDNKSELILNMMVSFKYIIEIEYASWGIKDINVFFKDILQLPATLNKYDQQGEFISDSEKILLLDMSKLKIDKLEGSGVFVSDLDIELNDNFEVDYNNSSITVVR